MMLNLGTEDLLLNVPVETYFSKTQIIDIEKRIINITNNSINIGFSIIERLNYQEQQIDRVIEDINKINNNLTKCERLIRSIKSQFGTLNFLTRSSTSRRLLIY